MPLPVVDPDRIAKLAAAYGIVLTEERKFAIPVLIDKAQELLPAATEQWVTDGATPEATVRSVVEDMVVRVLRNPRGLREVSIDDFSGTIDQSLSTGGLYLSEDELARLTPVSRSRSIGTIRVGLQSHRLPR